MDQRVFSRFNDELQARIFKAISTSPRVLALVPELMDTMPEDIKQAFDALPGIHCLTRDVLALILSKVEKSSLKSCFSVSKQWNAVMQTQAVWQPHIEREFASAFPKVECPNVFLFRFSSLKDKVGWMFWKMWKENSLDRDDPEVIHLSQDETKWLHTDITYIADQSIGIRTLKKPAKSGDIFIPHGFSHVIDLPLVRGFESWRMCDNGSVQSLHIRQKTSDDGTIFEGEAILYKGKYVPHGSGTWTFPDGSTLSGTDVAFTGKIHGHGWFAGEPMSKKQKV